MPRALKLLHALDAQQGSSCRQLVVQVQTLARIVKLDSTLTLDQEHARSVQLDEQMLIWIQQRSVLRAQAVHMQGAVKYSALCVQPGSLTVTAMRQHHVWNVQQVSTGWPQDRSIRF